MTRIALALAFFGGGLAPLFGLLENDAVFSMIPFPHVSIFLPALLLGLPAVFTLRSYPTSLAVFVCAALFFLSLLRVAPSDFGRGLMICAVVATTIPVASLIIKSGELRFCGGAFVLASLVNLFCVVYLSGSGGYDRLGSTKTAQNGVVSNANAFGGQMAAAAILTVTIFLQDTDPQRRRSLLSLPFVSLGLAGLFYLAVLMSGSRGAIISLAAATMVMLVGGRMTVHRIVAGYMALMVGGAAIVADAGFLSTAFDRFGDNDTLMTMGDRLPIWEGALHAFNDNRWTGVGAGGVEQAVAQYMVGVTGAHRDEYGVERKSSHNAYLEWIVAMGIPGAIAGLLAVLGACRAAMRFDKVERSNKRRSMLLFCLLFSITIILFRTVYWVPVGSLLFAMLSPQSCRHAVAKQREAQSTMTMRIDRRDGLSDRRNERAELLSRSILTTQPSETWKD